MKILITGGLGYIGSHIAHLLGTNSIIIDNMSNSKINYSKYLPKAKVFKKKINLNSLRKIFDQHDIKFVIHLAGFKSVNDSIQYPIKYYDNNISSTIDLLKTMDEFKIKKLIFSSSATVYGSHQKSPLKEEYNLSSLNPYGNTKIILEELIDDYSKSNPLFRAISLRYFNPIGANFKKGLADQPLGLPSNLMPLIIKSVVEKKKLIIYGDDYDTPDGTCIRDYIHVQDLAIAHIKALKKVSSIEGHIPINIGLGKGISVLKLIKIFEKTNNVKVSYKIGGRREGDAAISYANNNKAKKILKWVSTLDYERMCYDAWQSYLKRK